MEVVLRNSQLKYLQTIVYLHTLHTSVRRVDIASCLGCSKPSVTKAMNLLLDKGFITIIDGNIELSEQGQHIYESMQIKYEQLYTFFKTLGFSDFDAQQYASQLLCCVDYHFLNLIQRSKRSQLEL